MAETSMSRSSSGELTAATSAQLHSGSTLNGGHDAAALTVLGGASTSTPGSAHVPTPVKDAHGRVLNPRSCVTCRKRKVKCDKLHPCSNCARAHIECVFPTPGRAPRKARKVSDTRDAELLARLRRLEGVVKGLGVEVSNDDAVPDAGREPDRGPVVDQSSAAQSLNIARSPDDNNNNHISSSGCNNSNSNVVSLEDDFGERTRVIDGHTFGRLESRFGRLVVNEGKSRYINNSFWANLSTEVEDLKGILNEASDDDADGDSPNAAATQAGQHHGWVFSFSSQNVDLLSLHPIPVQIETYWNVYRERVDPLVKVLHIPTTEPTVLAAASHLANLSKSFEVLMFTIYYGAATSLTTEECLAKLGEERSVLLSRYRFAIEQALARANFLTTEELVVLEAFVVYLICLRRNNDARVIWTLTGLVVRIAQTIGVHRDGAHFGLTPFEIEMRRRVWWQVCILDVRASEDHGCDPTITEQTFDTKMPLNINDVDLDPTMKEFPPERVGCTDMSFSLIRFEVANTFRRLNYIPPGKPRACGDFFASVSLDDKERWITECHQRLEERYLKHCDMSVPMYWVTATVSRLMMSKMWLMVYHPFQRQDGGRSLNSETKEKLFITSLENMEYSLLLETEGRTMQWGWLFKTYMQWHALAFIMVELCHRTRGPLVDRAWMAVEKVREDHWGEMSPGSNNGHLWKPLMRLFAKAKAARAQALQEDAAQRTSGIIVHETTQASSRRPHITRAPLSAAQISRFMVAPSYGSQPINSTELMKSPRVEQTVPQDDPMDISTLLPDVSNDTVSPQLHQSDLNQQSRAALVDVQKAAFGTSTSTTHLDFGRFGGTEMARTSFSPSNLADANQREYPTSSLNSQPVNDMPPNTSNVASTGFSSTEDGSGDVDWTDWDQLMRQFGMDIDQAGVTGQASNLSGQTWGTMGSGLAPGFGMGTGDWF
ncbi:hypothetical protein MBLNU459_g0832t1 [Dothideomycetes sp. NU459]